MKFVFTDFLSEFENFLKENKIDYQNLGSGNFGDYCYVLPNHLIWLGTDDGDLKDGFTCHLVTKAEWEKLSPEFSPTHCLSKDIYCDTNDFFNEFKTLSLMI